jgi:hypothetical protein
MGIDDVHTAGYILSMNTTTNQTKTLNKVCHCGATSDLELFVHYAAGNAWVCRDKVACYPRAKARTEQLINASLASAMTKAGVSGSVKVETHQDSTDSWADYTGYIVTAESKELLERASKWVAAYARKKMPNQYVAGDILARNDGSVFVRQARYSLGE